MNLSIDIKEKDNGLFVKVAGEIDAYTAPKLKETLHPSAEAENQEITVDLSEVSYMDSTGLGVFVGLFKTVKANGGQLYLNWIIGSITKIV